MAVASTGPATTRRPQASAAAWQSWRLLGAPAHDVDGFDPPADQRFAHAQHVAELHGDAVQRAAEHGPFVAGHRLAGPAAEAADGLRHVVRGKELGRVRIDERDQRPGGRRAAG